MGFWFSNVYKWVVIRCLESYVNHRNVSLNQKHSYFLLTSSEPSNTRTIGSFGLANMNLISFLCIVSETLAITFFWTCGDLHWLFPTLMPLLKMNYDSQLDSTKYNGRAHRGTRWTCQGSLGPLSSLLNCSFHLRVWWNPSGPLQTIICPFRPLGSLHDILYYHIYYSYKSFRTF